jgi:uncharacterized protein (DUF305 family)
VVTSSRLRSSAAVLGIAAVLASAGCSGTTAEARQQPGADSSTAPAAENAAAFNDTDVMFAQMVVPHHTQGVEIAELAVARSTDEQIKTLAAAIAATQKDEASRAAGWLRDWKKPAKAAHTEHEGHGGDRLTPAAQITKLKAAKGAEFDKQFLNTLVAHQDDAIQIARLESAKGENPQAKALAKSMEQSRAEQITMMLQMLGQKN